MILVWIYDILIDSSFNLKTIRQKKMVKEAVDYLNGGKNKSETTQIFASAKALDNDTISKDTTHLIVDFDHLFGSTESLKLFVKCKLLFAALNRTRIVRYEWLTHSLKRKCWLDEKKYLLANYIEQDGDYDENEFDLRLLKLIENLDDQITSQLFQHERNIFIFDECHHQNDNDDDDGIELKMKAMTLGESSSSSSSFLEVRDRLRDYLSELIVTCGGHVTSRLKNARLMIAIDKMSSDYASSSSSSSGDDQTSEAVEREQSHFRQCIDEMEREVMREQCCCQVLSSDWIIDSLLERRVLDKTSYMLYEQQSK